MVSNKQNEETIDRLRERVFSLAKYSFPDYFDFFITSFRSTFHFSPALDYPLIHFYAAGLFLCPLKRSRNLWFSDVFMGYRKRSVD